MDAINTLTTRAKWISDTEHIEKELNHLSKIFKNNNYTEKYVRNVIHKKCKKHIIDNISKTITLPYIQGTRDNVAKFLNKNKIRV